MAWIQFGLSAAAIVFVAFKMTQYADVIAARTRLSGMFIGVLLLAAVAIAVAAWLVVLIVGWML